LFEPTFLKKPITSSWLARSKYVRLTGEEIDGRSPIDDFTVLRRLLLYRDVHIGGLKTGALPNTATTTLATAAPTSAACTSWTK
jgi:hypothetical protein